MKGRLHTSQEMISNALAMTDALVNYGTDTAFWKPPPLPKDYMLYETTSFTMQHELQCSLKLPHSLSPGDHKHPRARLHVAPAVTVDLASPFSSIQRAVDLAPNWSGQRSVIYIKAGVYNKVVRIPKHKTNLMFMGDGSDKTIISGSMSDSQVGMITWATATVARNLYIDPVSKTAGLTLNPLLLDNVAPAMKMLVMSLKMQLFVVWTQTVGMLLELPTKENLAAGYVHISNVSVEHIAKLEKKYTLGKKVRARVIGHQVMDALAIASLKESVVEQLPLSHADVKPAMNVTGTVVAVEPYGALVQLAEGVKALCPLQHMLEF